MSAAAEATAEARTAPRVRTRKPLRKRLSRVPFYLLIAAIFIYTVFPFYWAIRSAITPDGDLFATPLQYFPNHPTLTKFREVLESGNFQRALLNSTIVAGSVTLISLVLGSLAALRARALPLPRPLVRDVPDALDDDLPADRDPRRALHDDQQRSGSYDTLGR